MERRFDAAQVGPSQGTYAFDMDEGDGLVFSIKANDYLDSASPCWLTSSISLETSFSLGTY